MTHHLLKTWSEYFWEVAAGRKTFELRENDREYAVGDTLNLAEYHKEADYFTGYVIAAEVTYILNGPSFGLGEGYCIMGLNIYPDQPAEREAIHREIDEIF